MEAWFAVLALVAIADAASISGSTHFDTIVVGLGASGTAAATELAHAGKRVLALEAQGRVGGRVNTVSLPGDSLVEMGAEWIHGQDSSVTYQLALDNNVTVLRQELNTITLRSDGGVVDAAFMEDIMNFAMPLMEEDPATPEPLGAFMTRRIKSYIKERYPSFYADEDFIQQLLVFIDLIVDSHVGSNNWNDSTTHTQYVTLGGNQEMSWHVYGYKTLFEIMMNTYKNGPGLPSLTIELNKEVTSIQWPQDSESKVVVRCKDGSEYTSDNVIVTVSVGVLKERHASLFSPALPQDKVDSINGIPLGVVDKIVLLFAEPWWPKDTFMGFVWKGEDREKVPEEDKWTTMILGANPPMSCERALTLWTCGEVAKHMETLSEEVVKAKSVELLEKFANRTIPKPVGFVRSTWYSNPYTRGSYSFDSLTSPSHPSLRPSLASPLTDSAGKPRVLFAGEATNPIHYSTVHGAVETGRREARRLLGQ
ncbi:spermine oxidase-like isoform X1 [Ostrinia furnacalis]|uniref:spermine oxidase-like isoform X1 n=2 Tax=Ostrinia furnacalis TaxID=93504 RepID=UPI00103B983C|nr:spermine oxidase-like isoform X1 [Ostrinia furnacalis]